MKKLTLILILFLLFSGTANALTINKAAAKETGEELTFLNTTDGQIAFTKQEAANIHNLKQHTVIVMRQETDGQYRGTGIAIDKRHILTANHNTSDTGQNFYFEHEGTQPYWATVVKRDKTHDIALLEIDKEAPDLIADTMTFAKDIKLDETVYTIGHPKGNLYQLTTGKISYLSVKGYDGITSIELNIRIKSGNSGGFVINQQGEIVGMIFSAGPADNMGQMIGKDDIVEFIRSWWDEQG